MPQTFSTGVVSLLTVLAFWASRMKASAVQAYAGAVYEFHLCVLQGRPPVLAWFHRAWWPQPLVVCVFPSLPFASPIGLWSLHPAVLRVAVYGIRG